MRFLPLIPLLAAYALGQPTGGYYKVDKFSAADSVLVPAARGSFLDGALGLLRINAAETDWEFVVPSGTGVPANTHGAEFTGTVTMDTLAVGTLLASDTSSFKPDMTADTLNVTDRATFDYATASTDAVFDANKRLVSNAVTGTGSSVRANGATVSNLTATGYDGSIQSGRLTVRDFRQTPIIGWAQKRTTLLQTLQSSGNGTIYQIVARYYPGLSWREGSVVEFKLYKNYYNTVGGVMSGFISADGRVRVLEGVQGSASTLYTKGPVTYNGNDNVYEIWASTSQYNRSTVEFSSVALNTVIPSSSSVTNGALEIPLSNETTYEQPDSLMSAIYTAAVYRNYTGSNGIRVGAAGTPGYTVDVQGTLGATGATTLQSSLAVTGASTFTGIVSSVEQVINPASNSGINGSNRALRVSFIGTGQNSTSAPLWFGKSAVGAGIAGVQTTIDNDQIGLVFFTHPSGVGADPNVEAARFAASGNLLLGTTTDAGHKLRVVGTAYATRFLSGTGTSAFDTITANVLDIGTITGGGLFDSMEVDGPLYLPDLTANRPLYLDADNKLATGSWSGTGTVIPTTQGATLNNPTLTGTVTTPTAITMGSNTFTRSGAHALTLTTGATTNVTLPASGTLYGTATGSITSAQLAASLTNETGSGAAVFGTSPTIAAPTLTGTTTIETADVDSLNTGAIIANYNQGTGGNAFGVNARVFAASNAFGMIAGVRVAAHYGGSYAADSVAGILVDSVTCGGVGDCWGLYVRPDLPSYFGGGVTAGRIESSDTVVSVGLRARQATIGGVPGQYITAAGGSGLYANPKLNGGGFISGVWSRPEYTGVAASVAAAFRATVRNGDGSATAVAGLYIDTLQSGGGTVHAIYSPNNYPSYLGGDLTVGGDINLGDGILYVGSGIEAIKYLGSGSSIEIGANVADGGVIYIGNGSAGNAGRVEVIATGGINSQNGPYHIGGAAGVTGTCSSVTVVGGIVTGCTP